MRLFLRSFDTLTLRIAVILAVGTMLATVISLLIAEQAGLAVYQRFQNERVLASATDVVMRLRRDPDRTLEALTRDAIIGASLDSRTPVKPDRDTSLSSTLDERLGFIGATLAHVDPAVCASNDPFWRRTRIAGFGRPAQPECWILTTRAKGRAIRVALYLPRIAPPPSVIKNPLFVVPMGLACLLLSVLAARLAGTPLRRLSAASRAFAYSIDAAPVAETGPRDVREALATFNLMQERVREGLRERTRLLAAISHDLQTPLTRLRLRLEQVSDESLREKLIKDLSDTLRMVRRGLDLARSGDSIEDWAIVDLDSLLVSMVDDAVEFGHSVRLIAGCGARVRVKPDALTRCLANLIDNAVKYAGSAELSCAQHDGQVIVKVLDRGDGMPPELLARAFEPFLRGDTAAEGSGIGLAIARAQAAAIGGTLTLEQRDGGGLEAVLTLLKAG